MFLDVTVWTEGMKHTEEIFEAKMDFGGHSKFSRETQAILSAEPKFAGFESIEVCFVQTVSCVPQTGHRC